MSKELRSSGKTERQLTAECETVVNRVIARNRGKAPADLRMEMRKAFSFGPQATQAEKRIWEKTLEWAMKEVEKWPRLAVIAGVALVITCSAAQAEQVITSEQAPPKVSFAMRHPKLHKAGRFVRRTCQILQPIVAFGGSVAQIATSFK